jgi:hypothetical protein
MAKSYIGISAIIFALVAIGHLVRIVQGWQVQLGDLRVAMSVPRGKARASVALQERIQGRPHFVQKTLSGESARVEILVQMAFLARPAQAGRMRKDG